MPSYKKDNLAQVTALLNTLMFIVALCLIATAYYVELE